MIFQCPIHTLDNLKSPLFNKIRSELENDNPDVEKVLDSFSFVILGSVLAIIDDQRSGNGEKTRYLIHSLCEDFKFLIKEICDNGRRSPAEIRIKHRIKELRMRKRKKQVKTDEDSSDEECKLFDSDKNDEDDGENDAKEDDKQRKDMILPLLATIIEWFTMIDRVLKDKKISVALRMVSFPYFVVFHI